MSKLRDVPPVSGAIIWVKQIERRLRAYLDRVGAVLGKGWEQHVDGQRLQQLGSAFLSKLNTQKMFEQWMAGIQAAPSFEVTGHIFLVTHRRGSYALSVNFDPQIVELFKEVRNLQWLGFRIPYTLKMISEEAKEKYPFAMSLNTTMASYQRIITLLDPAYKDLVASYVQKVQRTVELSFSKGKGINWDSELLSDYTREFSSLVLTLQSKVDDLVGKYKSIKVLVDSLKTCEYTHEAFASILGEVQRIVDEMNLASYSNLQSWVLQLENDICTTLAQRLSKRVEAWKRDFEKLAPGNSDKTSKNLLARRMKRNASDDASSSLDGVAIAQRVHEIVLRKHALDLNPPLETSRLSWIGQLHDCVRTVCDQKPIRGNRYDDVLSAAESGSGRATYGQRLVPRTLLCGAYEAIETRLGEVSRYVNTWMQYQSLWDMENDDVEAVLQSDLNLWMQMLGEIKQARATFDTAKQQKSFGAIVVDFRLVQAQVSLRYDAWHKDIMRRFVSLLGEAMVKFHGEIQELRNQLEQGSGMGLRAK